MSTDIRTINTLYVSHMWLIRRFRAYVYKTYEIHSIKHCKKYKIMPEQHAYVILIKISII